MAQLPLIDIKLNSNSLMQQSYSKSNLHEDFGGHFVLNGW